jgi:hypothetical protein
MAEHWLTYEEVAAAFHIGKESARTLVKRKPAPHLATDPPARPPLLTLPSARANRRPWPA